MAAQVKRSEVEPERGLENEFVLLRLVTREGPRRPLAGHLLGFDESSAEPAA